MRNRISRSLLAAMVIAAAGTITLGAQSPQTAGTAAAATQAPANVNVVNVPTVTIGNTALQPIPVKAAARDPVHLNFTVQIEQPYSTSHNQSLYSIPAGKRLTVEHFSVICASDSAQEAFATLIANGQALTYMPAQSFSIEGGVATRSVGATPVSAIVESGSIWVYAGRSKSVGFSQCFLTVAGYLTAVEGRVSRKEQSNDHNSPQRSTLILTCLSWHDGCRRSPDGRLEGGRRRQHAWRQCAQHTVSSLPRSTMGSITRIPWKITSSCWSIKVRSAHSNDRRLSGRL